MAAPAQIAPAAAPRNGTAGGPGSFVQVSSQRSEAEAQAAFRSLQAKFPTQLGGKQPQIHRVDLGAKGIYFRAMVGPFANASEATELCSSLKGAGGQAEMLNPAERGIRGNSHMIMQDKNNLQIADFILQWIDERVSKRTAAK